MRYRTSTAQFTDHHQDNFLLKSPAEYILFRHNTTMKSWTEKGARDVADMQRTESGEVK